jgi:monofunctional biosynthetic peptidoglycan transglycosylase
MIAACLPNPKRYTVKPASPFIRGRSNWILAQMMFLEKDTDIQGVLK